MFKVSSLDDFNLLRESSSIEFKLAGGRDGKGELPQDFWPTYSAMANTDGGVVVLGVRERKDETPIHDALREALANVLVHADYSERASVLVIKQADKFRFRNPGLMRVPVSIAIQGGEPDCRNRMLHKMFRLVGVGEQAGSGIPIILQGWKSQHWSPPNLYELREPYDQTVLELRMVDLFPSDVMDALHAHFGAKFEALDSDMRLILALASIEETVSHARLITALSAHPVEITRMLQQLCQAEMLVTEGSGKGTVYFLPWQKLPTAEQVFGPYQRSSSIDSVSSSVGMAASSVDSANSSIGLNNQRDESGRLITEHLCLLFWSIKTGHLAKNSFQIL